MVAINLVWLVVTIADREPTSRADEAYGECRAAIRKLRPEAARIAFPTRDLIRVSRRDAVHHIIRGYYYVALSDHRPTRYVCQVTEPVGSTTWTVGAIQILR